MNQKFVTMFKDAELSEGMFDGIYANELKKKQAAARKKAEKEWLASRSPEERAIYAKKQEEGKGAEKTEQAARDAELIAKVTPTTSLSEIARIIRKDWDRKGGVNFAAKPYLSAMTGMDKISDDYGQDSGKSIVLYFLSNASTWKGEVAKHCKAILNKMAKSK